MLDIGVKPRNATLLTGLPRSGTTLICALLNEFSNTVALAEPVQISCHGDRDRAVREIGEFIAEARQQILTRNEAVSKHVNGVIPENWVEPPTTEPRLRRVLEERGPIRLNKTLSSDFHLFVKHPAEFSALADLLTPHYTLVAMVRHPLSVLAAWQTVDMPVNRGRMPMAEAFNPELKALLESEDDCLRRQVKLIGWLLDRYSALPAECILRYEDLVADPLRELSRLTANAQPPIRSLTAVDAETRYPGVDLRRLAEALRRISPIGERFYPDFALDLST